MDLFELRENVAFVTGAGSGIGQRVAVGLAQAGADVALFDLPRAKVGLAETSHRVEALGRKAVVVRGSVTEAAEIDEALDHAEAALGSLTLAVNAAGVANAAPAESMALHQWRQMIDVNLTGVFLSCQAEGRRMLSRRRGAIVNIASMSGTIVNRGLTQAHYNAAKAAVIHLSKSLAMEWAEGGLRVNVVSPGYTATPMNLRQEVAQQAARFEADTPMGRMASVDEMVGPVVFLLSRAAAFVTGADLIVDGGYVCW